MKRRAGLLAVVVLVCVGISGPVSASYRRLSVSGLGRIVHDAEHRRLFVTGSTVNDRVLVLDYRGRTVDSIGDLPGASEMFLEDGTLYVSLFHSNVVKTIDAETHRVTGEISLEPYSHPLDVSKTSNLLWASVDCHGSEPKFVSVDLESGVTTEHDHPASYPFHCAKHIASPVEDVIYTWQESGSTEIRKYRVGAPLLPTQPPTLTLEATVDLDSGASDVKLSADGAELFVAGGGIRVFRASDLVETGSYPQGSAGVAPTSDGRYVGGLVSGIYDPDVYVYEPGSVRPAFSEDIAGAYSRSGDVYAGDAVLLDRGARFYALSGQIYPGPTEYAYVHVVAPLFPTLISKGNQFTPVGGDGYLAWADSAAAGTGAAVMARGDGDTFRVSPVGVPAVAGGIDDGTLSYSRRGGSSWDVALYDLKDRKHLDVAASVNTRADEISNGVSGRWLLFERIGGGKTKLLLRNRENGRTQRLDATTGYLQGGQVNGNWAVWTKCERAGCSVYRWNISHGIVQVVPRAIRRIDHSASVARDGTVYFARTRGRCGRGATLASWNTDSSLYISEGGVTQVRSLPDGKDFLSTFVDNGGGGRVLIARYACRAKSVDVVEVREP